MRRLRTLPVPRFVEPASVSEGDVIRVVWKHGDIEISRTAKVAIKREMPGGYTKFYSGEGHEIVTVNRHRPNRYRFTLVAESGDNRPEPLFEMESV